eukprot:gene11122-14926_t
MGIQRNIILGYPLDIFGGPEILLSSSTDKTKKIHLCIGVSGSFCPWNKALMDVTKQSMKKKPTKHSLCKLLSNDNQRSNSNEILSSDIVRIFSMGGSATSGHAAWGCCCDSNLDSKCSQLETDLLDENHCGISDLKDVARSCSWPHFLTHWLATYLSSGNSSIVKHVDMASSGRYVLTQFDDLENSRNLVKFTSNDIVILDHSVNDNHMFNRERGAKVLEMGLEKLINAILRLSVSESWPTIIIVDYWPYAHHYSRVDAKIDHSKWYKEIASRYEIPLLSWRDLAESDYMASNFSWLEPVLDSSINSDPLHPPWFVHLALADMIGVYLQEEFASCLHDESDSTRPTKEMIISTLDYYLSKSPNAAALSESISGFSNWNRTLLLNLKAQWAFYPNNDRPSVTVGSLLTPVKRCLNTSVCSFDEWNLMSEKKQRVGWVYEHHTENITSPLVFAFTYKTDQVPMVGGNVSSSYDLRVGYLNTYENAGAVHVYACGVLVGNIDSLWKEAAGSRYSAESFVHFKVDIMNICIQTNNNLMGNVTLNITFIPIRYVNEGDNQRKLRKNSKFKLTAVSLA